MVTKKASPKSILKAEAKAELLAEKRRKKIENFDYQIQFQLSDIESCVSRIRWLRKEKAGLELLAAPVSEMLH